MIVSVNAGQWQNTFNAIQIDEFVCDVGPADMIFAPVYSQYAQKNFRNFELIIKKLQCF